LKKSILVPEKGVMVAEKSPHLRTKDFIGFKNDAFSRQEDVIDFTKSIHLLRKDAIV